VSQHAWCLYLQELILKNVGKTRKFGVAHQAELKLLSISFYFVAVTVIALAIDSFVTSITPSLYANALLPYFTCESTGLENNDSCQPLLSSVQRIDVFHLSLSFTFLSGFLPVVVFLFSVDFRLIATALKGVLQKLKMLKSEEPSTNITASS
jgi:hypothetical protein